MNKGEIVEHLMTTNGYNKTDAKSALAAVIDAIIDGIARDGKSTIADFAVFETVDRAPRMARNPRTGEAVPVPAREVVRARLAPSVMADVTARRAKFRRAVTRAAKRGTK
jgi:DNA-binding protein HU-beta